MGSLRDRIFSEIRSDYNQNEKDSFLYRYLRNGKLKEKCDKNPEKEKAIIHKAATDLMYNMGYALAAAKGRSQNRNTSRSHNTALDLIDAWWEENPGTPGIGDDSDLPAETYQNMFNIMNREKKTKALIPVKIDPAVGTGVYIVGRDLYPAGCFPYDKSYSCGIGIIGEWDAPDNGDGVCVYMNVPEEGGDFPDIKEALEWYRDYFAGEYDTYLGTIREWNGDKPGDAPKAFSKFFGGNRDDRDAFEEISTEELKETEGIFK